MPVAEQPTSRVPCTALAFAWLFSACFARLSPHRRRRLSRRPVDDQHIPRRVKCHVLLIHFRHVQNTPQAACMTDPQLRWNKLSLPCEDEQE